MYRPSSLHTHSRSRNTNAHMRPPPTKVFYSGDSNGNELMFREAYRLMFTDALGHATLIGEGNGISSMGCGYDAATGFPASTVASNSRDWLTYDIFCPSG